MAKTREIKGRLKAVGNIQRITKTMQMIATARFQAAQRRATASKPYSRSIGELVRELASTLQDGGAVSHPLLRSPDPAVGRELLLVITSDRGLCGAYNASLLRVAGRYLRSASAEDRAVDLEVVGKKGQAFFRFAGRELHAYHSQFGDKPGYEDVERLVSQYMSAFSEGQYDAVRVLYMAFHSMSRQSPEVLELLPLKPPVAESSEPGSAGSASTNVEYEFTPGPEQLLAELLPITVKTQLFQCFNESNVGEQIARMVAMKAATDAARDMKRNLTRQYNRARQTAITTELTEIISGSAALEDAG